MGCKVLIGTSGWHYTHWRGSFYPQNASTSEWLRLYADYFNTVELNNSFYHLPSLSAFDSWRATTPADFVFAVKGSRFITHMKKLKDPESATLKFFKGSDRLAKKLGPILFQLPPRWRVNARRLDDFLNVIPRGHRYVFEFRDESWYTRAVYEILQRHNAALCIHDLGGKQSPLEITASFTYLRFHGPQQAKYTGSYSSSTLRKWAEQLTAWRKNLSAVYVYFNNDVGGFAPKNALKLKSLLH